MQRIKNIEDNFNIFFLWKIIYNIRKRFLYVVIIGICIGILRGWFSPTWYSSKATILFSSTKNYSENIISNSFSEQYLVDIILSIMHSSRMRNDIIKYLGQHNISKGLKFRLIAFKFRNTVIVEARSIDPRITKEIAEFSIVNLDNINNKLNISYEKPMVKVLDQPSEARPIANNIIKYAGIGGIFCFISLFIIEFFKKYIKKLKNS